MSRCKLTSLLSVLTASAFAVSFVSCSAVKRGQVVKKGIDEAGTKLHPGPIYWVDLRGENSSGKMVTARVEFFAMDWHTIQPNDWVAPASYGVPRFFQRIHAYNEAQRAESGRFGATEKVARVSKPGTPRKRIASRAPADPTDSPAAAAQVSTEPPEQLTVAPAPPAPPAPVEADAGFRSERLREVREIALEDASVRELKATIKTARNDEEQQRAWREYRATLRDKMFAIDPSLGDLIE